MLRQALTLVLCVVMFLTAATALVDVGEERRTSIAATAPAAIASPASVPLVREVLSTGLPPAAPGQQLDLARYVIAPGATLPVHVHPGMQAAWIESGELTYHVLTGEVPVTRQVNQPGAAQSAVIAAGETTVLRPHDAIVEVPGVVHYGENLGTEPVIIWAATLFATGQPSAIPVNPEGTPVG